MTPFVVQFLSHARQELSVSSPAMAPLGDSRQSGEEREEAAREWGDKHSLKGDKVTIQPLIHKPEERCFDVCASRPIYSFDVLLRRFLLHMCKWSQI